jgi:hypothetical protein
MVRRRRMPMIMTSATGKSVKMIETIAFMVPVRAD